MYETLLLTNAFGYVIPLEGVSGVGKSRVGDFSQVFLKRMC